MNISACGNPALPKALSRDLDAILLVIEDATLVIAVTCGARPAHDRIPRLSEFFSQVVDLLPAADTGSQMVIPGRFRPTFTRPDIGAVHDFQSGAFRKSQKIRAKPRARIMIAGIGDRAEKPGEKLPAFFQVRHINRHMFNLLGPPPPAARLARPVSFSEPSHRPAPTDTESARAPRRRG